MYGGAKEMGKMTVRLVGCHGMMGSCFMDQGCASNGRARAKVNDKILESRSYTPAFMSSVLNLRWRFDTVHEEQGDGSSGMCV